MTADAQDAAPAAAATSAPGGLARWAFLATAGLAGGAPLAWALLAPDARRWLLIGAAGWVAGVALKIPVAGAFAWAAGRLGLLPYAAGMGLVSAAAELGLVAAMIAGRPPGDVGGALALGVGAGCLEAVTLAAYAAAAEAARRAGPAGDLDAQDGTAGPAAAATGGWLDALAFPVERLLVALPGHVGSRALVAAACLGLGWGWGALALLTFAVVDGVPAWAERAGWSWSDARTLGRYYLIAGAIGWAELTLAWMAWR